MKVGTSLSAAIVLIALGFAACQMPDATGGPNSTGEKAIKLMDGNGNLVGYVIGTSTGGVGIHTSKGYFFGYGWAECLVTDWCTLPGQTARGRSSTKLQAATR